MYTECVRLEGVTSWKKENGFRFNRLNWSMSQGDRILMIENLGSGSKELFDIIVGYQMPQEGKVMINGRLAVIQERFPVLEGLTVKEYMNLAFEGSTKKWGNDIVDSFLKEHELWEKREYTAEYLTLSERCRLQFAMAQALEPNVLIMGSCWKYLRENELEQFWNHVRKQVEETGVSFMSFSEIMFTELDSFRSTWTGWFSHIYALKNGILTEVEMG